MLLCALVSWLVWGGGGLRKMLPLSLVGLIALSFLSVNVVMHGLAEHPLWSRGDYLLENFWTEVYVEQQVAVHSSLPMQYCTMCTSRRGLRWDDTTKRH